MGGLSGYIVAGVIAAIAGMYLVIALIAPERF
jgi:K+-transporting ATPase KdpF subunit